MASFLLYTFGKGDLRYKKGIQMLKKGFRSIGKFAKKLISCQGHFHCELSTRGIGKFTEKLISCQGHFQYRLIEFQPFKENIYIPLCPNALVSTTSTITGSWSEKLHVPTWAHIF